MTAHEYNKIDSTYVNLENEVKVKCKNNDIKYHNYLGVFVNALLPNYVKAKELIVTVTNLDFNDKISAMTILNKANIMCKNSELTLSEKKLSEARVKLFKWLDNVDEPYFFIMNPVYNYGPGIDYKSHVADRYGYLKNRHTGSHNLDVAVDYARYKLNKKTK